MATKAEEFRYWQQRSGPKKPKQPRPARRSSVDTAQPGVSASDRKAVPPRNEKIRAGKKALFALEVSSSGRPSRKSTRKSANRQKNDVQTRIKRRTSESRPRRP
jgi:hypothetical protein